MGAAERVQALMRRFPDWPTPGVLFQDIAPVLADPSAFAELVAALAGVDAGPVDAVAGIEARGFILAAPVALHLGAGFVPVRKQGKLPGPTHAESYALEYGTATLEVQVDAFPAGARVLVVDDVLATGGTVAATRALIERAGARVAAVSVLLELTAVGGRDRIGDLPVHTLLTA